MPALKIFPHLTTRPFASDDLQIACFVIGLCRVLQVICIAPVWVFVYMLKFKQGQWLPFWCQEDFAATVESAGATPAYEDLGILNITNTTTSATDLYNTTITNSTFETGILNATNSTTANATSSISNVTDIFNSTTTTNSTFETLPPTIIISTPFFASYNYDDDYDRKVKDGMMLMRFHLLLTLLWCLVDLGIVAGIWSASNVGTPTQFMGRDRFLRPLLRTKILVVYPVTAFAVIIGLLMVYYNRQINYGCKNADYEPGHGFEGTSYYTLFCIVLFSQSIEVFFWPSLLIGKVATFIRRFNPLRLEHAGFNRSTSIDVCMTGIFKFCSLITCKRTDMKKSGELKDAAEAALEFFRDGVGITWSDLYIACRVLAQVQRERKLEKIQRAQKMLHEHFISTTAAASERQAKSFRAISDSTAMNRISSVHCNATTLLTGDFLEKINETSTQDNPNDDGGFGRDDTSTVFFSVNDSGGEQEELELQEEIIFFDDDGESSSSTSSSSGRQQQQQKRKVPVLEESIDTNTTTDNNTEDDENRGSTSSSDKQQQRPAHARERSIPSKPAPTSRQRQHQQGQENRPQLNNFKGQSVAVLLRNDDVSGEFSKYEEVFRSVLTPDNSEEVHIVRSAIRYAKHSNAVYDDVLNLCKSYYKLGIDIFQIIPDGNMGGVLDSFMEHSIVLDTIGIGQAVLAYSHFRNGMSETPYYISVDEDHREIVLTIRGTASLEDAVIDLQLIPSDLTALGVRCGFNGKEQKCHRGVLTRCIWIYDDLKTHGVLRDLLLGENSRYPFFNFIVTGHSLGAGCAAMLSCMLRNEFPHLKCFAFEPPGGLMTEELADYCKGFVTSFVNGADIIPRMSYVNCEKLRDEALETLARVRVSKAQVYRSLRKPHSDKYVAEMNSRLMYPPEETPKNTAYYADLEDFRKRKILKLQEINIPLLYLPGKIVYLIRTKKGKLTERGKERTGCIYSPQWAERTDFNEILLSNRLVDDHSMTRVISNLSSALEYLTNPNTIFLEEEEDDDASEDMEGIYKDKNPTLVLERDFICCSRPHGIRPVIGAIFATAACIMCMVSNSTCILVDRTTELILVDGGNGTHFTPPFYGTGVSTGLFNYEERIYTGTGNRTDPANYEPSRTCQPFPLWFKVDRYLQIARAFGTVAVIMSGAGMLILLLSTSIRVPRRIWIFMSCLLVIALVFQAFVIEFYYRSSACTEFEYQGEDAAFIISSECVDSDGANFAKASVVALGATFLLTVKYPKSDF